MSDEKNIDNPDEAPFEERMNALEKKIDELISRDQDLKLLLDGIVYQTEMIRRSIEKTGE